MPAQQPPGIGFRFDVLPWVALELVADKTIQPADVIVLLAILRFYKRPAQSVWMPNGKIEELTGLSRATIKRSVRALKAANLVERVEVPKPDPHHPENNTGYRFELLFCTNQGGHTRPLPGITDDPSQGSHTTPRY